MRLAVASLCLTCLLACGGPPPAPGTQIAHLAAQLERTGSSDAAMYLLLDLEALAQAHPEQLAAVVEILEPRVEDPRHVVRGVAIRALASLQPGDAEALGRLQRYLLDPHEPLELRDAVFHLPVSASLPSREEIRLLLHRQAVWTGRRITHE